MKIMYISKLIRKMCRIIISYLYVYHTPLTHRTSNRPPLGRLSEITGTDKSCPDEKLSYTKVAQNGSMITDTIPIPPPHPSNIPIIEPPPLRTVCRMIRPVLLKYPDEFISNTKVVRNRSTKPDTPPTRVSDVHDTSGMIPPSGHPAR